ncbi:hypothetical protein NM688_g9025 [Phlebia brevispora]|uniref:Uncharacterized protein n=1 Tax=Phlebia brevispora TaxID=194682 RepID=A0ACC1RKZ9_9APHY|nr:hypothetical protein NM688_g9025 [Phlebia brevispora]
MPSVSTNYAIDTYTSALDLPDTVWESFAAFPRDSNVMYPHALKARRDEQEGRLTKGLWIVCTSTNLLSSPSVDFVLSCTDGPLGSYPVFIFTPIPPSCLDSEYVHPRLEALARALLAAIPSHRVFSVFAPDAITLMFTSLWTDLTGVLLDPEPRYYAAKITYCTKRSFRPRQTSIFPDVEYTLRLAREDDISGVAELCLGFARESEPFVLSEEGAQREASTLVQNSNVWVHEIWRRGQQSEIASIVAVTRTSDTVAAITKVYTNLRWRKRGCAERLTREVTKHLLKTKDSVVLYVAHNNPAAAKVYNRVGFVGIGPESESVEGVDSWLELGFDRKQVQLGHW